MMHKTILLFLASLACCATVKEQPETKGNCGDFFFKKIKVESLGGTTFLTINTAKLTFPKDSILQIESLNQGIAIEFFAKKNYMPDYCADKQDVAGQSPKKQVFYCRKGILKFVRSGNKATITLSQAHFKASENKKEVALLPEVIAVELEPAGG